MNARGLVPVLTLCLCAGAIIVPTRAFLAVQAAPDPAPADAIQGKLTDGSNYRVVKPATWNGTLVLDLDFANRLDAPPSTVERWMVANGYAIGGISREPVAYRFRQAVDDLLTVRRSFSEKWGNAPRRTLTWGVSRGAFVSRLAMEFHPEIFEGALLSAGGGAGEIGTFNSKLDGLWTLRTLTGAPLKLVDYDSQDDAMADNTRLGALVTELRSTPAGRARLALAAAFEQFPTWTSGDNPPAATDHEAQVEQIAGGFGFANPAQVRYGVERVAGGNFSWNHGVDYTSLLARSGMSPLVEAMYTKAGISLKSDLDTLTRAPRIASTAAAVAAAEQITSYTGKIRGPIVVVDNIGDPVDADAYKRAYEQTLTKAGTVALHRLTWVRSAGHSSQSALERITGFLTLVERLDTGKWSETSPEAMTARAAKIAAQSAVDLGRSRFIPHTPPEALRPWDGTHWGSYAPSR